MGPVQERVDPQGLGKRESNAALWGFLKLIQTLVYWLISMNSVRSNKGLLMLLNNKDLVFVTSTFTCQLLHGSWQVLCLGLLNWINTEEGEAQKIPSIRRCWDI